MYVILFLEMGIYRIIETDMKMFIISPLDSKKKKLVRIPLAGFPERPPKTTRIELKVAFTDEGTMTMSIRDKGFGELFPSSGAVVKQEVNL